MFLVVVPTAFILVLSSSIISREFINICQSYFLRSPIWYDQVYTNKK